MSGTRVVKVGGSVLSDPAWLCAFAGAAAVGGGRLVLVHGGGAEVTALSERLGIASSWVAGRRVTSAEAMEVTAMVLSGRINKRIVGALLDAGLDAVGLSGEDGGLLAAELLEGGALGRVGRVGSVRTGLLESLLSLGIVPVISPVSRGPDGGALNVNADEAAAAVAVALGAAELLFLTDVAAVRDASGERAALRSDEAATLVHDGQALGGMAVKLEAAVTAAAAGVARVRVGPLAMLHQPLAGTRIAAEAAA